MSSFLAKILKNKKIVILGFLLLFFAELTIPILVQGQSMTAEQKAYAGLTTTGGTSQYNTNFVIGSKSVAVSDSCHYKTTGDAFYYGLIYGVGYMALTTVETVAGWATSMYKAAISTGTYAGYACDTCIENNKIIKEGWPKARDVANMGIVLGFVFIGITLTLRISGYEVKKLLPQLIIVALLINFSLVICGVFVDGANTMVTFFIEKQGGLTGDFPAKANGGFANILRAAWEGCKTTDMISAIVGNIFYDIIYGGVLFLYACLFFARHIALWILTVFSPIAFICGVFPFTQKISKMWWSNFLGWCIIGIPGAFCVYIADSVIGKLNSGASNSEAGSIIGYLIPAGFLLVGFFLSLAISATGSDSVVGAGKWVGGFALGAVSGAAAKGSGWAKRLTGGGNGSTGGTKTAPAGGSGPTGGRRPTGWGGGTPPVGGAGTMTPPPPGSGPGGRAASGRNAPTPTVSGEPKQSFAYRAGRATRNAYEKVTGVMPSTDTAYRAGRATRNAYEAAKAAPGKAYDTTIDVAKSGYNAAAEGVKSRYEGIKEAGGIAEGWAKSGYEATKEGIKSRYEGIKEAGGMVGSGAKSAGRWIKGKFERSETDIASNIKDEQKHAEVAAKSGMDVSQRPPTGGSTPTV